MRNKRLMEVFKRKSLEMREVVYRLTGYRVDASGDNHYKLINMYAESADDFFLFEVCFPVYFSLVCIIAEIRVTINSMNTMHAD